MSETKIAVAYGAKSSEDTHGSIPTQLDDCRKLAAREGWEVVADYEDEAKSAFHGNRGAGLARAQAHAERLGCALIVQHSDRLARGDGDRAQHLVEIVLWARKAGVRLVSVQDPQTFDGMGLVYAALMGDRNHEDSARKSQSVKDGLRRRKERGAPVGSVPLGYKVRKRVVENETITKRVIDPQTRPTVERIFDLVESGSTFGDVARTLNAEGVTGRRGKPWVRGTVREVVHNTAYKGRKGGKGYSKIIDPDRFDAIHAGLTRLDPATIAKRRPGRQPRDDSYILRGVGFCGRCGGKLYTRPLARGRIYICRNVRQSTGLCDAPPIPADLLESHVLRHLDSFVGSVEDWITQRLGERDVERQGRERALERQRAVLVDLDRQRDRFLADYRKLEGKPTAYIVLEEVERIDGERADQEQEIREAEAVVSEWSGPPDLDAVLDYYNELVDHVQGRIRKAEGAGDLNRALSQVLAGLWAELDHDRDRLLVEFELVGHPPDRTDPFDSRPSLPPRWLGDQLDPDPLDKAKVGPTHFSR